ncbi:hypothetical protein KIPB_008078, partial [Kipferlia bialata]|eukprot:g8078.t1
MATARQHRLVPLACLLLLVCMSLVSVVSAAFDNEPLPYARETRKDVDRHFDTMDVAPKSSCSNDNKLTVDMPDFNYYISFTLTGGDDDQCSVQEFKKNGSPYGQTFKKVTDGDAATLNLQYGVAENGANGLGTYSLSCTAEIDHPGSGTHEYTLPYGTFTVYGDGSVPFTVEVSANFNGFGDSQWGTYVWTYCASDGLTGYKNMYVCDGNSYTITVKDRNSNTLDVWTGEVSAGQDIELWASGSGNDTQGTLTVPGVHSFGSGYTVTVTDTTTNNVVYSGDCEDITSELTMDLPVATYLVTL